MGGGGIFHGFVRLNVDYFISKRSINRRTRHVAKEPGDRVKKISLLNLSPWGKIETDRRTIHLETSERAP